MTGQATTAAVDAVAKTWNASGFNLFLGQCGDDDGDIENFEYNDGEDENNNDGNDGNNNHQYRNMWMMPTMVTTRPIVVSLFSFHSIPQKPSSVRMQFV